MNKIEIAGMVASVRTWKKGENSGVILNMKFWGFKASFFLDRDDKALDFLLPGVQVKIFGELTSGKKGLAVNVLDIQQLDFSGNVVDG